MRKEPPQCLRRKELEGIYVHDDLVVLRSLLQLAVLNHKRSRCRETLEEQVETLAGCFQGETSDVAGIGRPRLGSIRVFEQVLEHPRHLGFKAHRSQTSGLIFASISSWISTSTLLFDSTINSH